MISRNITPGRRYDIDWLRVLGMLAIFIFHCSRYFDLQDWHVKNPDLYGGMSWLTGFMSQWIMPLFFVISAVSTVYSLKSKSNTRYILSRAKRLLIPFLLGTFVIIIPLQVYIERITHGGFEGGFWAFYPRYFQGWYAFGGNFAWMGLHLWYLEMLFIFSLLTLPIFRFLLRRQEMGLGARLAGMASRPLAVYLFFIPLAVVEMLVNLDPDGLGIRAFGGWSLFSYLMIFLMGFLIGMTGEIKKAIEKQRYLSLFLSLILTATGMVLLESGLSSRSILFSLIRSLNMWCWLFSFMGFAGHHLCYSNRFLRYANASVLPFYVLHQTLIVGIGYLLITWEAGLLLKWPVLGILSFSAIMVVYELLIRRFSVPRMLFGMKP